jgi:hypothetical protein
MTNESVVAIGIRLFGLLTVLNALASLSSILPLSQVILTDLRVGFPFALQCGWLGFGALLSWKPAAVARSILPRPSLEETKATWDLDEFQAVLFSAVGIYLLATTLTDLTGWTRSWAYFLQSSDVRGWFNYELAAIGTMALRLAVGSWLLLGARGLIGVIRWLRGIGTT